MKLFKNIDQITSFVLIFYFLSCALSIGLVLIFSRYILFNFILKIIIYSGIIYMASVISGLWITSLLVALILGLASLNLPYLFYNFLRTILFTYSVGSLRFLYVAIKENKNSKDAQLKHNFLFVLFKIYIIISMSVFTILFNPFILIHFEKNIWTIIDQIIAGLMIFNIPFNIISYKKLGYELY